MQVRERTSNPATPTTPVGSPDWVADWWIPAAQPKPADADLPALLVPQPVIDLRVTGRAAVAEATA